MLSCCHASTWCSHTDHKPFSILTLELTYICSHIWCCMSVWVWNECNLQPRSMLTVRRIYCSQQQDVPKTFIWTPNNGKSQWPSLTNGPNILVHASFSLASSDRHRYSSSLATDIKNSTRDTFEPCKKLVIVVWCSHYGWLSDVGSRLSCWCTVVLLDFMVAIKSSNLPYCSLLPLPHPPAQHHNTDNLITQHTSLSFALSYHSDGYLFDISMRLGLD